MQNKKTLSRLVNKYPRLCSQLKVSNYINETFSFRTDLWMVRFMEEAYDDALVCCSKPVSSTARRRKRCGLDLGSMDAFPLVVKRLLNRTFSVMAVRDRICIEFLLTLDDYLHRGDGAAVPEPSSSDGIGGINGQRSFIFRKFLSEEWDVDYLAIFLYHRELLTKTLQISSLKDLAVPRVFDSQANQSLDGQQSKEVQRLPANLRFVEDFTIEEAPLVAFNIDTLRHLCTLIGSDKTSASQRAYLASQTLRYVEKQKMEAIARSTTLTKESIKNNSVGILSSDMRVIPLYTLLYVLCEEWQTVPTDSKSSIGEAGREGASLKKLNEIYDNNCETMVENTRVKKQIEAELSNCGTLLLKLEKTQRKLERRWEDNIATEQELNQLQDVRISIVEAKADRLVVEAKLKNHNRKDNVLSSNIENLWDTALATGDPTAIPPKSVSAAWSSDDPTEHWKHEVTELVITALNMNEYNARIRGEALNEFGDALQLVATEDVAGKLIAKSLKKAEEKNHKPFLTKNMKIKTKIKIEKNKGKQLPAIRYKRPVKAVPKPPVEEVVEENVAPAEDLVIEPAAEAVEEVVEEKPQQDEFSSLIDELEGEATELLYTGYKAAQDIGLVPVLDAEAHALEQERLAAVKRAEEEERVKQLMLKEVSRVALQEVNSLILEAITKTANQMTSDFAEQELRELLLTEQMETESFLQYKTIVENTVSGEIHSIISTAVGNVTEVMVDSLQDGYVIESYAGWSSEERHSVMEKYTLDVINKIAIEEMETSISHAVKNAMITVQNIENDRCAKEKLLKERKMEQVMAWKDMFYPNVESSIMAALGGVLSSVDKMAAAKERKLIAFNESVRAEVTDIMNDHIVPSVEQRELARVAADKAFAFKVDSCCSEVVDAIFAGIYDHCVSESLAPTHPYFGLFKALVVSKDPWGSLDEEPSKWLSDDVLNTVEEYFLMASMNNMYKLKKECFHYFHKVTILVKRMRERHQMRYLKSVLHNLRNMKIVLKRRRELVTKIQRFFKRIVLNRKQRVIADEVRSKNQKAITIKLKTLNKNVKKLLLYWKYVAETARKYRAVVFCMNDRRFIISFYTWRLRFKEHKEARLKMEAKRNAAAQVIQCSVRCRQAKIVKLKKVMRIKLIYFFRVIAAQRKVKMQKINLRKLQEIGEHTVPCWLIRRVVRQTWNLYRKHYNFAKGLNKVNRVYTLKHLRSRFRFWNRHCQIFGAYRNKKATIIQSGVRMNIIQRYVLNYYSWRRGLTRLQAYARMRIGRRYFWEVVPFYRAAIFIQRVFRGHFVRSHLTQQRIKDMHYAATENKYDKLLYYVEKYPELLTELDDEGNTSLHNAAKTASRRTLKLLVRSDMDPNALNLAGYSALHFIIMSAAINRDDLCLYMLDRGFDEDQLTPDGKSTLLLACENGRATIVHQLLENGMDPNIPDHNGTTCLQTACSQGYFSIVKDLLENGANCGSPGYAGTFPLHDCVNSGDIRIANVLFSHGAFVNVAEHYHKQSPLMWACAAGHIDIVRLYLIQGANVKAQDELGYSCTHHCSHSDTVGLFDALREADADFDILDNDGNTPLHIAVEHNALNFVKALLEGAAHPSFQNKAGNQPSHIAARDNNVAALKLLTKYDEHMGRMNYSHETPLGMAKFHSAFDAIDYLEGRYSRLDDKPGFRNEHGDIWWDSAYNHLSEGWKVVVNDRMERSYVNEQTGEETDVPPLIPNAALITDACSLNELPLRKNVQLVQEENRLTKHAYVREYAEDQEDVEAQRFQYRTANKIIKTARMLLAKRELGRLKKAARQRHVLKMFFRTYQPGFKAILLARHAILVNKIVAHFRGYNVRKRHKEFVRSLLQHHKDRRILGRKVICAWRMYKHRKVDRVANVMAKEPQTPEEWTELVSRAPKPLRVVGVYEQYSYNRAVDLFFYRHAVSGEFTLQKPKELQKYDDLSYEDKIEIQIRGHTKKQKWLAIQMQKLWRGFAVRRYYLHVEKARQIAATVEIDYMSDPDGHVHHLYNYALFCHCVLQDYPRARRMYVNCLEKMESIGPDVAMVLYSYVIFIFVTHEQDYADCEMLLHRARKAEESREVELRKKNGEIESLAIANGTYRHGKIYEYAKIGMFQHKTNTTPNLLSWHNYAACCFLVFNDYTASFDAFLHAFRYDPSNKQLKENFDLMMAHFWGNDKDVLADKVTVRMRYLAAKDNDYENIRRARLEEAKEREFSVKVIQRFVRNRNSLFAFKMHFQAIEDKKVARQARIDAMTGPSKNSAGGKNSASTKHLAH